MQWGWIDRRCASHAIKEMNEVKEVLGRVCLVAVVKRHNQYTRLQVQQPVRIHSISANKVDSTVRRYVRIHLAEIEIVYFQRNKGSEFVGAGIKFQVNSLL